MLDCKSSARSEDATSMKVPTQRWRNKTIKPIKVAALMPQ